MDDLVKAYGKAPDRTFFEKFKKEILGSVKNVKWAKVQRCFFDEDDFLEALKNGDAEVLGEIPLPGCFWRCDCSSLIPRAIRAKNLPCLKVLVKKGLIPNLTDMSIAVPGGGLEIIKYLWSVGCSHETTSAWLVNRAVEDGGDLDIVKFLVSKDCKIDASTCAVAGTHGRLEILQWLRSVDCSWDEYTVDYSIRQGINEKVVEWAMENGCPFDYTEAMDRWADDNDEDRKSE